MRDSKYIITMVVVLVVILGGVLFALFYSGGNGGEETVTEEPTTPFADTSTARDIAFDSYAAPIQDFSDEWSSANSDNTGADAPLMRLITKEPVIGAATYLLRTAANAAPEVRIRYVLHKTGNIEETPLATIVAPTTLSQKTILRIGETLWTRDGKTALIHYLNEDHNEVYSFVGRFGGFGSTQTGTGTPAASAGSFTGRSLPNNLHTAAFSPDGTSIFYLVTTSKGQTGFVESIATGVRTEVWHTPFRDITAQWNTQDSIVLHMNPSLEAEGAVWVLDPVKMELQHVLGNEYALSPLMSDDGTKILYSMEEEKGGVFSLRVHERETGKTVYLPIPTIADKCTWERFTSRYVYCAVPINFQTHDFLELWYRGAIIADDTIWRFDTTNGAAKRIAEPSKDIGIPYDIVDLHMSPTNEHLVFRTRNNNLLWALRVPTVAPIGLEDE